MSFNTFGKIFRFTTWGESHGPAIGCVIDGCPPNIRLTEKDIQADMDRRRPGQSKFTTQRKEPDKAIILSGVFEGKTTGTPISIIIYNEDKKSRDYESIKNKFRPGHADYTYFKKYGIRDFRGGGRQSARETASRVAAGAVARVVLKKVLGKNIFFYPQKVISELNRIFNLLYISLVRKICWELFCWMASLRISMCACNASFTLGCIGTVIILLPLTASWMLFISKLRPCKVIRSPSVRLKP